jgi:hypothetical protein
MDKRIPLREKGRKVTVNQRVVEKIFQIFINFTVGIFFFMFTSVGMPDNFNMIIAPVKKFLYINGFGGTWNDIDYFNRFL